MPKKSEKTEKAEATTLTLFAKMHTEIVSNGQLNKHLLRAAFGPQVNDRQFAMAFHYARMQLEDEGYFLKPVPRQSGMYAIATAEDVAEKAMNKSRLRVVKAIDRRAEILVNAQKNKGLDEAARMRINVEEVIFSRFQQVAHRTLMRHERKKPDGL